MDFKKSGIAVLIPAYKPEGTRLIALIQALLPYQFSDMIIVDDGSGEAFADVFVSLKQLGCLVITHEQNKGKGRALKTGLAAYQAKFPNGVGVVTADADGQHLAKDIANVAEVLDANPEKLVLGCRTLGKEMPFTSRFGNTLTRVIFSLVSGVKISDTQTGLRGIPTSAIEKISALKGERYEFEMHMLLELRPMDLEHVEVKIETIYLNNNASSHFNRFKDSILIYQMFLKYIFVGIGSFIIDYGIYSAMNLTLPLMMAEPERLLYGLPLVVIIANITGRVVSSCFNFLFNRKILLPKHHKGQTLAHHAAKYYLLVLAAMLIDTLLVSSLSLVISRYIAKIIVGLFIFIMNFFVQKRVVYV